MELSAKYKKYNSIQELLVNLDQQENSTLLKHFEHMNTLATSKSLILGGPHVDASGMFLIFTNMDAKQVDLEMEADPLVMTGMALISGKGTFDASMGINLTTLKE